MSSALDIIRQSKRNGDKLTTVERLILHVNYLGGVENEQEAEDAAEELATTAVNIYDAGVADGKRQRQDEIDEQKKRITELESGFEILANATVEDGWILVAPQFVDKYLKGGTS